MWAIVSLNILWNLFNIFYTFPCGILQSAVEFWNNSSRKQMASANEYFGPTMYRWGYHQRSKGIQARLKKNSFIQEFVPNYTLDAILAPRFTRDPQNIVFRPPTFCNFFVTYFHQFRIYESTIFFTKNILFSFKGAAKCLFCENQNMWTNLIMNNSCFLQKYLHLNILLLCDQA